jgi:DNA-binding NarL/FixJ family response regulator
MEIGGEPIRILIVDDHPIMRVGIAAIINAQPGMQVVGQAGTAGEAVRLFEVLRPDLTLMDLRLPDRSGVEAIRSIRAISPKAKIVVLTTYEGDEDIHQALNAGARGYLIKGMPHDALAKALQRVSAIFPKWLPRRCPQGFPVRTSASASRKSFSSCSQARAIARLPRSCRSRKRP